MSFVGSDLLYCSILGEESIEGPGSLEWVGILGRCQVRAVFVVVWSWKSTADLGCGFGDLSWAQEFSGCVIDCCCGKIEFVDGRFVHGFCAGIGGC